MTATDRAHHLSNTKLDEIRARLQSIVPSGEVVLTCGSYARREASPESDIDFFIITGQVSPDMEGKLHEPGWADGARSTISSIVPIEPAEDGAFSSVETRDSMLVNIGGDRDNNHKITRRMLILLEGEWLFNESGLNDVRRHVLERYIGSGMTDHQLALFLLNDIIRYYRTIAVDYEFKITEGGKPWGIRNIKLVFSRKLLYASGLFAVALTADAGRDKKIALLEELFRLPVIERMTTICGKRNMEGVLKSYDIFLDKMEKPEVRSRLKELKRTERDDPIFRELKNEGHHFTRELLKLFEATFDSTHPIHRAVVF
jgi:hypothetical protein